MNSKRLRVPYRFWSDHLDRFGNSEQTPRHIRGVDKTSLIEGTCEQIKFLRADAAYYADAKSMDRCPTDLRRSARATVKAIDEACARDSENKSDALTALKKIASQKLTHEIAVDDLDRYDFADGYDAIIMDARAAIAKAEAR